MDLPFNASGTGRPVPSIPPVEDATHERIFQLANWMASTRPWKEMSDANAFAVVDPVTGQVQIAAILGQGGTVFALHLYQPEEGTRWYTRLCILGPEDPIASHLARYENHYIEAELIEGATPDAHDAELMGRFGPLPPLRDAGKKPPRPSVLTLRSAHPGCPPWHPDQAEAERLADALLLLRRFHDKHLDDLVGEFFVPDEDGTVGMPTFRLPDGADRRDPEAWQLELETHQFMPWKQLPEVSADEVFDARLARFPVKPGTRWEHGSIFRPDPILDGGKPAYPVVAAVAFAETGRIDGLEVASSQADRAGIHRRSLAKAVESVGYLPEELMVGSPIAELAFARLAEQTGIRIIPCRDGLPLLDEAFDEMEEDDLVSRDDLDGIPPGALESLDEILKNAPAEGVSQADVIQFLAQLEENEAGSLLLRKLAKSAGMDSPEEEDGGRPGSGSRGDEPHVLTAPLPHDPDRYVMRVDLLGMKPPIWRRLSLPAEATFRDLHHAVQAAFAWEDCHLHEFQVRDQAGIRVFIGSPEVQDGFPVKGMDESLTKLKDVFHGPIKQIHYVYDFGDDWTHLIRIEKKVPAKRGQTGPQCHAGRRIAPPEDCGGIPGFLGLLDGSSECCEEFDEDELRHFREGKFSPKDVPF